MGEPIKLIFLEKIVQIIQQQNLIAQAADTGNYLTDQLVKLEKMYPMLMNSTRGKGMFIAFDILQNKREKLVKEMLQKGKELIH